MEKKILMLATVLTLLCLVLVTPLFLGQEESQISTIPELLIDHAEGETRIYVQGAVETYRYSFISIEARDLSGGGWKDSTLSNNTISLSLIVKDENTTYFQLNVTLMRATVNYTYGCTVQLGHDQYGEILKILLPDEKEPIIHQEEDFPFRDVILEELEEG
ncbi:MAG: hypothetical protein ACE5KV_07225 [Thermoplasmata archaeon]